VIVGGKGVCVDGAGWAEGWGAGDAAGLAVGAEAEAADCGLVLGAGAGASSLSSGSSVSSERNETRTALRQISVSKALIYSCFAMGMDWSMVWAR